MAGTIRQQRAREMLQQIAEAGESHDAIAKQIGVSQPFVSGIIKGSRACGEETLDALKRAYLVHEDYFSEPDIGGRSWRDFRGGSPFRPVTRVERDDAAVHPVVEQVLRERHASPEAAARLRAAPLRLFGGTPDPFTVATILSAIEADVRREAEARAAGREPAPKEPPPVPEGKRRVGPGKRGR